MRASGGVRGRDRYAGRRRAGTRAGTRYAGTEARRPRTASRRDAPRPGWGAFINSNRRTNGSGDATVTHLEALRALPRRFLRAAAALAQPRRGRGFRARCRALRGGAVLALRHRAELSVHLDRGVLRERDVPGRHPSRPPRRPRCRRPRGGAPCAAHDRRGRGRAWGATVRAVRACGGVRCVCGRGGRATRPRGIRCQRLIVRTRGECP